MRELVFFDRDLDFAFDLDFALLARFLRALGSGVSSASGSGAAFLGSGSGGGSGSSAPGRMT